MKYETRQTVQVLDVLPEGTLRLDALFNVFQEAAVAHSRRAGVPLNTYLDSGKSWVLSRVAVQITTLPQLDEAVAITTWSRGINRFKGFREFELQTAGQPAVVASTMWIYLDIAKSRPVRAPADFEQRFGIVAEHVMDIDLETISFAQLCRNDFLLEVATRISDYDINGHVNNAVILQYVQTALVRFFGNKLTVRTLTLGFLKEIPLTVDAVTVVLQETADGCLFSVKNTDQEFVRGSVTR